VEKRWDDVRKFAIEALKISAANAEALNLKTEAENNLSPTLTVNAYVDGKKVNAVIRALKTEPDRSKHPWRLVKGKEYAFEVFYRDAQGRYSGEIPEFRCKQNGLHFKNVTLKKMFDGIVDCKGVKLEMQKINAGTFIMGSPEQELSRDDDEVPHKVTLTSNFWIGKYEVTQAQYAAVMNTNPSEFKGFNHPVEMVSYDDAKEFCKRLNQLYAGRLPRGYQFDLPTEAQWEYACRAGTSTALNNGSDLTTDSGECSNMNVVGWYYDNRVSDGHKEVGLKHPNAWGLYDMHGNVYEWCRDWYGPYKGDASDPVGPDKGTYRVLRGGGWDISARRCRAAFRFNDKPTYKLNYIGFRLALVPIQ
jgi:formylglycine-generating enzyme required for sulfatase activity